MQAPPPASSKEQRVLYWINAHRGAILALCLLAVGVAAIGLLQLKVSNSYRAYFGPENPDRQAFEAMEQRFEKADNVLLVLKPSHGKVFRKDVLELIAWATEQAWQIPYASRVNSLTNFPYSRADGDTLYVGDLFPPDDKTQQQHLLRMPSIAAADPRIRGLLIDPSWQVTAINITFQLPRVDEHHENPQVMAAAHRLADAIRAREPHMTVAVTGMVPMNDAFSRAAMNDGQQLIPLAFLAIFMMLWLFLNNWRAAAAIMVCAFAAMLSAMGIAGWAGLPITATLVTAPLIIMTVAVAGALHLFGASGIRMGYPYVNSPEARVARLGYQWRPILIAGLTTAGGFLSLNVSEVPPFRHLGNIVALGVIMATAFTLLVLPWFVNPFKRGQVVVPLAQVRGFLHRAFTFLAGHTRVAIFLLGASVLALSALSKNSHFNDSLIEYFAPDEQFRSATEFLDKELTGLYRIEWIVDSGTTEGLYNPAFQTDVDRFTHWLRQHDAVTHVSSISDTLRHLNANLHGDQSEYYKVPESAKANAQALLMYELSLPYGASLSDRIELDRRYTRISLHTNLRSAADLVAFANEGEQWAQKNLSAVQSVTSTGTALMFARIGLRNISTMIESALLAMVVVSVLLVLLMRSWQLGLAALAINLLPATVGFGIWSLIDGQINLALSLVAALTLGIVVDDTVHLLWRYRQGARRYGGGVRAAHHAVLAAGPAMTATSIVLIVGFAFLSTSDFLLNADLGAMGALIIALALVVDLALAPLLLSLGWRSRQ